MAAPDVVWKGGRFGQTSRRDPWWLSPSAVFVGLSAFLVYSTWAAWQGNHYTFGPYISPFYSPETLRLLAARSVRSQAGMVPRFSALLSGAPHSLDSGPFSAHVLLLPRRLLQVVLGRPSGVFGWRAAQDISRGTKLSPDPAEFPSLLSTALLPGVGLFALRRSGVLPFPQRLRDRDRKPRPGGERCASRRVCIWLPRVPPPGRRHLRSNLGVPGTAQALRLRELSQRKTPEVGMGQSVLGGIFRHLCSPLLDGDLA